MCALYNKITELYPSPRWVCTRNGFGIFGRGREEIEDDLLVWASDERFVSRYDDVWFKRDPVAWAVNSNGHILKTSDDGESWAIKFRTPLTPSGRPIHLRCITFANADLGFVGTLHKSSVSIGRSMAAKAGLASRASLLRRR